MFALVQMLIVGCAITMFSVKESPEVRIDLNAGSEKKYLDSN